MTKQDLMFQAIVLKAGVDACKSPEHFAFHGVLNAMLEKTIELESAAPEDLFEITMDYKDLKEKYS